MNLARVLKKFESDYTRYRPTLTNTASGQTIVWSSATIRAYIHPDDYKTTTYNGQGDRLEERVKIFIKLGVDIQNDDEVSYLGKRYRVMRDTKRVVGNYNKLIAELVR